MDTDVKSATSEQFYGMTGAGIFNITEPIVFCSVFYRILALPACWWWCSGTENYRGYQQSQTRDIHKMTNLEIQHGYHIYRIKTSHHIQVRIPTI